MVTTTNKKQSPDRQYMTAKEVANALGVHPYTVHDLLRTKKLVGFKLKRRWRIKKSSVTKFIHGNTSTGE